MRAIDFLVEHQRLDEVNMSPSSLKMLVKSIGATAGMEFEMIVPNVDNPSDAEYEPDYDSDERSSSFGHIEDFFMGGDGNNSRSDVRSMIERLQEQFWEWQTGQQDDEWHDESRDYITDYVDNNDEFDEETAREEAEEEIAAANPELDRDSEDYEKLILNRTREKLNEFIEEILEEGYGNRIYDRAYEEFRDNHDGYDEGDWLWDNYKYMTDVYNEFGDGDVYWPYTRQVGGDEDIENVAESFSDAIGRPCNASSDYHGVRKQGEYTVEPDGSLDPDSSDDTGLEFVSPPLPLTELVADLADVIDWAESYGCYTNESTGLHMNVSVPSFSSENLDYTKLAILLGDDYILNQFGRQANNYCRSAIQKVKSNIGNKDAGQVENLLKLMKQGLAKEASDLIHSGMTDKYTSINTKKGYVEFRSPGGDWLNENIDKLTNTLYRFVVALDAACDPNKYKEEYYKKLYKLLNPDNGTDDYSKMINDFAQYSTAVGGAPQKIVADFRRLALATLKQSQGKDSGDWWWNVAINGQRVEVVGDNPDDAWQSAVVSNPSWNRFNKRDAKIQRLRPFVDDRPENGTKIQGRMQNGGLYKIFSTSGTLIAGDEYGSDQEALERAQYWAQHRNMAVVVKNEQGQEVGRVTESGTIINTNYRADEDPAQQEPNFYIVDGNTNRIVNRYYADDSNAAYDYFGRWKQRNDPEETGNYRYGRLSPETEARYRELAATQPVRQTASQPQGNWGIWVAGADRFAREPGEYPAGQEVPLRRFATQQAAEQFLQQTRAENPRMRNDVEVRQIESQGGQYEAYNTRTGQVLIGLSATTDDGARAQLANYLANAPQSMRDEIIVRRSA